MINTPHLQRCDFHAHGRALAIFCDLRFIRPVDDGVGNPSTRCIASKLVVADWTLDVRADGFKFLGFGVNWRRSRRTGRHYPHVEPHPQSQMKLREKLREKLNHWTLWRSAEEVVPEVNRLLKGWGGYFHYANSTQVFNRMNLYAANRLRRWLWRKGGGRKALWAAHPNEVLRERYGLYPLPTRAAWVGAAT